MSFKSGPVYDFLKQYNRQAKIKDISKQYELAKNQLYEVSTANNFTWPETIDGILEINEKLKESHLRASRSIFSLKKKVPKLYNLVEEKITLQEEQFREKTNQLVFEKLDSLMDYLGNEQELELRVKKLD